MAGDTTKATLWPNADVYVAPLGTSAPATVDAAWPGAWDLVGLLDGEQGFEQERNEDVNDHYAWGGILVRTSRKNFKLTVAFTALEDNDITRALVWPDSPAGQIIVPKPQRQLVGFELVEGDVTRRLISAHEVEIAINGAVVDKEDDLTRYPFLATIFPTAGGVLFTEQKTEVS